MRSWALIAGLALSACAPVARVVGGPDLELPPALAAEARVVRLDVEAPWAVVNRYAETQGRTVNPGDEPEPLDDLSFRNAIDGEIRPQLDRCATGVRRLEARVRIERLDFDDRFRSLWDGQGHDRIEGLVEFADPAAGGAIVGRYRIVAEAGSGKLLRRIVTDRTDSLAEAFGRQLCRSAFGRD